MPLKLDKKCQDLLTYFLARSLNNQDPIRYGDLIKSLNTSGLKITRPTLSKHLEHLTDLDLVTRTVISRANVNYQLNSVTGKHLIGYHTTFEEIEEFTKRNKDIIDSGDLEDQIDHLVFFLVLRQLYHIKYEILTIIEPEKEFEYNIRILTDLKLLEHFLAGYFMDHVRDDEEYREKALIIIEKFISKFKKLTVQPISGLSYARTKDQN